MAPTGISDRAKSSLIQACTRKLFQSNGSEKKQQKENQRHEARASIRQKSSCLRTPMFLDTSAQGSKHINASPDR